MTKKVVLLAAGNDFASNVNVANFTSLLAPPLGILALGSYLAQAQIPVELIDVQMDFGLGFSQVAEQNIAQRVAQYLQPQADTISWIGISQLSNSGSGISLAKEIYAAMPHIPIIMGGYFPSSAHQSLLHNYPFITAIVHGDGEIAAKTISQRLASGQPFLNAETPNLIWLQDGKIQATPCHPVSLDTLPILDFRLLRNPNNYQIIDLMTSRGCPFKCNYCLEKNMRPYATHSPDWVAQQLAHLEAETPNNRVFIYDPVFGLGKKETLALIQVMEQYRFSYAVESRVDALQTSLIPPLVKAGVQTIFLGIESASKDTLLRMNKVSSAAAAEKYVQSAKAVLKSCFENNLTPVMGFMLGFPDDTEKDYQETLEFTRNIHQIYDKAVNQFGKPVGFVLFAFYTKIYEGSNLADSMPHKFPHTTLRQEPFVGEQTIIHPSPSVDLSTTQHYQAEISKQGRYTELALERLRNFFSFSMEDFLAAHPELTDSDGITLLGDSLRQHPQAFSVQSTLMQYNKSKTPQQNQLPQEQ